MSSKMTVPGKDNYIGKHIGPCSKCGFTLLADVDSRCPRCDKVINKCGSCGFSLPGGNNPKCPKCHTVA
jgi:rubrerythrin